MFDCWYVRFLNEFARLCFNALGSVCVNYYKMRFQEMILVLWWYKSHLEQHWQDCNSLTSVLDQIHSHFSCEPSHRYINLRAICMPACWYEVRSRCYYPRGGRTRLMANKLFTLCTELGLYSFLTFNAFYISHTTVRVQL